MNKLIIDTAWLAGIFDGEGCVQISWKAKTGAPHVALSIVNTSTVLVDRAVTCIEALGISPCVHVEPRASTRQTVLLIRVNRKHDVLKLAEILEQFCTAKLEQLRAAIWYLKRSTSARQHKVSSDETRVLRSLALLKRGEQMPDDVKKLLS